MSDMRSVQVKCPACGKAGDATIYSSINVTVDPQLQVELLSGRLHVYHCAGCGQDTRMVAPFMYHDMQRPIAVWYLQGATAAEAAAFAKKNALPAFLPAPDYLRNAPIVTSEEEFMAIVQGGMPTSTLPATTEPGAKPSFLQRLFKRS